MPNSYIPLVEVNAAEKAWQSDKTRWRSYLIRKYARSIVKLGSKQAISATIPFIGGLFEAPAIVSTHRHISHLHVLDKHYSCSCASPSDAKVLTCSDILTYVITQKTKKRKRRVITAMPVIAGTELARSLTKNVQKRRKGTLGSDRELHARCLHMKTRNGCRLAMAIVAELVGNYQTQRSWVKAFAIRDWEEGWKVIKDKMAST